MTDESPLEPKEALQLLWSRWGSGESVTAREVARIERHVRPGETLFRCLCRIANLDLSDVRPFDVGRVRAITSQALARLEIAHYCTGNQVRF